MGIIAKKIMENIKPSLTLLVEAKAAELRSKGFPVISLGAGEPDFDTPENIKKAAINAIHHGLTKYTPSGGYRELKNSIVKKFKNENNLDFNIENVCASSGAKQAIYNALLAGLNPGDEVIIIAPYWVSYPEMVKLAGGVPIIVKSDLNDKFKLDLKAIESAINPNTKCIIINSPNNPSGTIYSYDELKSLAQIILKHQNLWVLSDDIYEHIIYNNIRFYTIAEVEPLLRDRIITVNGVSKSYAMTGWRIGYCAGPADFIKAISNIQTQTTSAPCSIAQMAAVEALNGNQDFINYSRDIFQKRRDLTLKLINEIPGLSCKVPDGAFYLFVDCSGLFGKVNFQGKILNNSDDVTDYFLEFANVGVVSGTAFGVDGFIRISYATNEENLKECCERIKIACRRLS